MSRSGYNLTLIELEIALRKLRFTVDPNVSLTQFKFVNKYSYSEVYEVVPVNLYVIICRRNLRLVAKLLMSLRYVVI